MTKQEFQEWKSQEASKEVFKYLNKLKEAIYEAWGKGGYTTESSDGTVQANANAIGQIQGLNEFLNISYEELTDE